MINNVLDSYADIILAHGLGIRAGDVLTINTEEENTEFAWHLAGKAKAITGNGCYLQTVSNGKIVSSTETETGHFLQKKPTAFLYLPSFHRMPSPEYGKTYSAPELQQFRLLSDPLDNNTLPLVPFSSAFLPSESWGEALGEDLRYTYAMLSSLLLLEEDQPGKILKEQMEILQYETGKLNSLALKSCHMEDEHGTDLTFSFLPDSVFTSDVEKTKDGRTFVPTLLASSIFRAVDPGSVSGYFTTTRPFTLFGETARTMTVRIEDGQIKDYVTDASTAALFELFLAQDQNAGKLSELSLSEETNPAAGLELSLIQDWDIRRTTCLLLGGPRARSLTDSAKAVDSLVSLFLPVGSDELYITAIDAEGNERTVLSDGLIAEED